MGLWFSKFFLWFPGEPNILSRVAFCFSSSWTNENWWSEDNYPSIGCGKFVPAPSIDNPPPPPLPLYGQPFFFSFYFHFFPKPPPLTTFFLTILHNEIQDKHKNKLKRKSYFIMFRRLQNSNSLTCFLVRNTFMSNTRLRLDLKE